MKKALIIAALLLSSVTLAACWNIKSDTAVAPSERLVASTNYVDYSADAVAKAQAEGKDVALFFHSKTCGSCAKLHGDITENVKNIPSDLAIFKTDWDDNQALAKQYKVDKYHTVRFLETEENVKGLFTLEDVVDASKKEKSATPPAPKAEDTADQDKGDRYGLYSPEKAKVAAQNNQRVVLNFKASRCPVCKVTTERIQNDIAQLPDDVIILEADYDKYTELKSTYNVKRQTTFVFLDAQGNHTKTVENVRGMADLLSNL